MTDQTYGIALMINTFKQHLLNHYHWIWIHTQDDALDDWFHNCIQNLFGKLTMNMLDDMEKIK